MSNLNVHAGARITIDEAIRIADTDAVQAYRDLSPFDVAATLAADGWHVDYTLKDPEVNGGGPHYVIDATTGTIVTKRYEQ